MGTLKTTSDIVMLDIPKSSMKNIVHQWKLEVNIFIISKIMAKKLKLALFLFFLGQF